MALFKAETGLRAPVIHPFVPQTPDSLFVEAQWVGHDHMLRRMGLHGHTFFEVLLIERGQGRHRLGRSDFEAQAGDLFIVPPGELHDCTNLGGAEGWVLLFTHQALEGHAASMAFCRSWLPRHPLFIPFLTLSRTRQVPLRLNGTDRDRWSGHIGSIASEIANRAPGYLYGVHAHLSLLLLDLFRRVGPVPQGEVATHDPVQEAVFSFIERILHPPHHAARLGAGVRTQRCPSHDDPAPADRTDRTGVDYREAHDRGPPPAGRDRPAA